MPVTSVAVFVVKTLLVSLVLQAVVIDMKNEGIARLFFFTFLLCSALFSSFFSILLYVSDEFT
jgi:hypothetical protein